MKKNLLGIIILLLFVGVWNGYGQIDLPTANVSYDKVKFCENEKIGGAIVVRMSIALTGSGTYDFDYYINYRSDIDYDQKFTVRAYNGSNFVSNIPITSTSEITIKKLYDDNYPIGGSVSGIINQAVTSIIIDALPNPIINTKFKTCRMEAVLTANPGGVYDSFKWGEINNYGNFLSQSPTEATFIADTEGNYLITYQVSNGACKDIAAVPLPLPVKDVPEPSATFQLAKDRICSDENGVLKVNGNPNNRYNLTLHYTDGINQYSEPITSSNQTIELAPSKTTTYSMLKLVDREGCERTLSDTRILTVDFIPVADAGLDIHQCGNEVELGAILNPNCFGQWIYEPAQQYFSDASSATSLFTVPEHLQIAQEDFILTWKVTNENNTSCLDENSVTVTLNKEPESIILSDIDKVYNAKEIKLEAEPVFEGMIGQWIIVESPSSEPVIEEPNKNNTLVKNLTDGLYTFNWMVSNGDVCSPVKSELSFENKGIYQTTGFSPNGDLVNDRFVIGGAENVTKNKLVVFDVTGKVVFEATDFCRSGFDTEGGWDGYQNNGERKDGTYYYIFTGDGIDPIKNYLIIKGSTK